MRFEVKVLMNHGPGMFWKYGAGDALKPGPVIAVEVDEGGGSHPLFGSLSRERGAMEYDALDKAWAVGNRMDVDADGAAWPSDVRSMSCADVLVIGEMAWAVDSVGFVLVPPDGLSASMDPAKWSVHRAFNPDLSWVP